MTIIHMTLASAALAMVAISTASSAHEIEPAEQEAEKHPEARLYDASIDASAAVDAAFARAAEREVNVLVVLGANWCHDSRAFAGWTQTDRIGGMIAERYELVFVNVGMPQTDDGHNLHIAERFGFETLEGTPTVLIVTPSGHVRNRDSAKSWRNAASRSEDEIFEELDRYPRPVLDKEFD